MLSLLSTENKKYIQEFRLITVKENNVHTYIGPVK